MITKLNGNRPNAKNALYKALKAGLLLVVSAAPFAILGLQMLNFFMAGVLEQ